MKTLRGIQFLAACLACVGLVIPVQRASGAAPDGGNSARAPLGMRAPITDIALGPGGRLAGTVVDGQGKTISRRIVLTSPTGEPAGSCTSAADGRFAIEGLRGGIYQLSTSETSMACRLWTAYAAPPAAADQLLIVSDATVERGQRPIAELFTSPPVLCGLIILAAIVIPIAVHNSRDDAS